MTKRILVTRPAGQADNLCAMIEAAGGEALRLPAIEVSPLEDNRWLDTVAGQLEAFQLAVFVSVNAVHAALPMILARRDWPLDLKIGAVGPTSTAAINDYGLQVDYVPQCEFSSEGLLAVDGLQEMKGKKVLIFRGSGGRSKLRDTLESRGAEVDYAEVYSRRCPGIDPQQVHALLQQEGLDTVTAASNETLQNLFTMAGAEGAELLRDKLLVVPGKRQVQLARELGCRQAPRVAGNASDEAMIAVLQEIILAPRGAAR